MKILNRASSPGYHYYSEGTAALQTTFKGNTENVAALNTELEYRARLCRWDTILTFQIQGQTLHLLQHYGRITVEDAKRASSEGTLEAVAKAMQDENDRQIHGSEMM